MTFNTLTSGCVAQRKVSTFVPVLTLAQGTNYVCIHTGSIPEIRQWNLRYVALTRAKEALFFVEGDQG